MIDDEEAGDEETDDEEADVEEADNEAEDDEEAGYDTSKEKVAEGGKADDKDADSEKADDNTGLTNRRPRRRRTPLSPARSYAETLAFVDGIDQQRRRTRTRYV